MPIVLWQLGTLGTLGTLGAQGDPALSIPNCRISFSKKNVGGRIKQLGGSPKSGRLG